MDDDRDFFGYGAEPPDAQWPGEARIAVNINLNFEGGGERSILEGDASSEGVLNDIGQPALPGLRSPLVEIGLRIRFAGRRLAALAHVQASSTSRSACSAVAKAAERNPELTRAFVEDGHEIVSHGYRWLDYQTIPEETEREHVRLGIELIERVTGGPPVGWMTGRPSANTRRLHRRTRAAFSTTATPQRRAALLGQGRRRAATWSSPIRSRPTTTASTTTTAFRPATISPAT